MQYMAEMRNVQNFGWKTLGKDLVIDGTLKWTLQCVD